MPLSVTYIDRLEDVVGPAVEFLERDAGLFARPRIVVPTAGAKAWLVDRLARRLGGSGRDDGVVALVDICFPGTITALLEPPRPAGIPDPWSFDRLVFAVLDVITGPAAAGIHVPFDTSREPLLAARRIAGLFDEYHVRRPGMIREWERAGGNPVLNPTANDEQRDGHPIAASLREADRWQFELWRAVWQRIGEASPPQRRGESAVVLRDPLLVAGLESLSPPQLDCLERLAAATDVSALLLHPSPGLRPRWAAAAPAVLPAKLRDMPLERRRDPDVLDDVDPLLPVWLAGSRDLEETFAARGIPVAPAPAAAPPPADTLLGRLQQTIRSGGTAEPHDHAPATDRSVVIHRCHSLSRQAEVVHDALLQAFAEIEGLAPHDVAIVSPCLDRAAPLLEAVFDRTVHGVDRRGASGETRLPLVVADRGIRELSSAAELLVALLALPGSRCSIDDVLGVAGHPLVRDHFDVDDDTVATWNDLAERTAVRWGLDAAHRGRQGLALEEQADVHTWALGLERMLLGATLPDAPPRPELGGVVPLADLDPADLAPIATLVRILEVIRGLDAAATGKRPAAAWCATIREALENLCGPECPDLAEPLEQLRRLRAAAAGTAAESFPVPFADVRGLLSTWFEDQSARQSFRTGAIMATSMVPLRGVPFEVICVVGYDDGAVGVAEADGDDLVGRQQLVGDLDPRIDERRALLDCLLAAGKRLVITCNGRSVKTNLPLPLVTPLAELVDFAVRHGVHRPRIDALSGIEVEHPRHHLSRRNFRAGPGGVGAAGPWSHDAVAARVAAVVGPEAAGEAAGGADEKTPVASRRTRTPAVPAAPATPAATQAGAAAPPDKPVISLRMIEKLADDPLRLFLEHTLGIDTFRDDAAPTPATLPLSLTSRRMRELVLELLPLAIGSPAAVDGWRQGLRESGRLPLAGFGDLALEEVEELVDGLVRKAAAEEVPLVGFTTRQVRIDVGTAIVDGEIAVSQSAAHPLVIVTAGTAGQKAYGHPLVAAAIQLAAARAAGVAADHVAVVARHDDWVPGALTKAGKPVEPCQIRTVALGPDVEPLARLAAWCDLAGEALAGRRGLFDLRDARPEEREDAFDAFVSGRNFATGAPRYPSSREAIAYGMAPQFAEIFAAGSPETLFLDRYIAAFSVGYVSKGKVYVLA